MEASTSHLHYLHVTSSETKESSIWRCRIQLCLSASTLMLPFFGSFISVEPFFCAHGCKHQNFTTEVFTATPSRFTRDARPSVIILLSTLTTATIVLLLHGGVSMDVFMVTCIGLLCWPADIWPLCRSLICGPEFEFVGRNLSGVLLREKLNCYLRKFGYR